MSERKFGIYELVILAALLGLALLLAIKVFEPELLKLSFFSTWPGSFFLGCFFCYLTFHEYKAAKSKDEWGPNRIAGVIRIPLYFSATLILFYIAASGVLSA